MILFFLLKNKTRSLTEKHYGEWIPCSTILITDPSTLMEPYGKKEYRWAKYPAPSEFQKSIYIYTKEHLKYRKETNALERQRIQGRCLNISISNMTNPLYQQTSELK